MSLLYCRLQELRYEYFNKLTNKELYSFYLLLDQAIEYTSEELIQRLAKYEDYLYPVED